MATSVLRATGSYRGPALRHVVILVLGLGLAWFAGRSIYQSLQAQRDFERAEHPDGSTADAGAHHRVARRVELVYRDENGQLRRVLADAAHYSRFLREAVADVEGRRSDLSASAGSRLRARSRAVFAGMRGRVDAFSEWYHAYGTGYRLAAVAAESFTRHALSPEVMPLGDAVTYDVQRYVERHYRERVLRPELTAPALRSAYLDTLEELHLGFLATLARFDDEVQSFAARHGALVDTRQVVAGARLRLDWDSQVRKLAAAGALEPSPGAVRGAALAATGAYVGRALGRAGGSLASAGAARALSARLATPLVARTGGAAAGAGAGAVGGPLGVAAGGAAGLGIDYLASRAVAASTRTEFEADVRASLDAQEREWERLMAASLEDAVDVWFEDLIQLLAAGEE